MSGSYPRWDVSEFLVTEERACLYLKAAAEDDTGNGDTIRLAWRDIQEAHSEGKISINPSMTPEDISRVLNERGVSDSIARSILSVLQVCLLKAA